MKTLFAIALCLFVLSGCSSSETKVTGQAFLQTMSGDTVKSSGMHVAVYHADELKQLMLDNQSAVLRSFEDLKDSRNKDNRITTDMAIAELSNFLFNHEILPVARDVTSGDGDFKLNIKQPGRYVLIARDMSASFIWLYPFQASGGESRIMLSNSTGTELWAFPDRLKDDRINSLFASSSPQ